MREYTHTHTHTHTHTDNLANKRKDKGITLIALVIATIILLILSGIVIIELTKENGLLDYIKISKEKHSISKAKEKLEIRIMQFKTEITDNQTLETFSDYLSKDVENGVYKIEKIYIDNKEVKTLNITDLEEYYTFEIDENFNINGPIESDTEIEATYEIVSSEGTKNNIVVSIKCSGKIQKIICPNGKVIEGNNKSTISIDYVVENEKQYEFIIQVQDKEEKFILDTNKNNNIVISELSSYAYPILTEDGIKSGKTINIEYNQNSNNYYSLDNR